MHWGVQAGLDASVMVEWWIQLGVAIERREEWSGRGQWTLFGGRTLAVDAPRGSQWVRSLWPVAAMGEGKKEMLVGRVRGRRAPGQPRSGDWTPRTVHVSSCLFCPTPSESFSPLRSHACLLRTLAAMPPDGPRQSPPHAIAFPLSPHIDPAIRPFPSPPPRPARNTYPLPISIFPQRPL